MRFEPIVAKPRISAILEKKILFLSNREIYYPIVETIAVARKQFFNSVSAIRDAILSGKIQYLNGIFKGQFSAEITKEFRKLGYQYDNRVNGFRGEINKFPIEIQSAIGQVKSNYQFLTSKLLAKLDSLNLDQLLDQISFVPEFEKSILSVNEQFNKTVVKKINVKANLSPEQEKFIAKEYSDNLKIYIKDFADYEIKKLRGEVYKNVFDGSRIERLQKILKESYGISDRKAKFLARQETNLLTAKYKQTRYASVGIQKYEWSTTPHGGSGVRESHKELNGTIHSFDNPPLISGTNRYCNPGEDYNCYCKAIPIFN